MKIRIVPFSCSLIITGVLIGPLNISFSFRLMCTIQWLKHSLTMHQLWNRGNNQIFNWKSNEPVNWVDACWTHTHIIYEHTHTLIHIYTCAYVVKGEPSRTKHMNMLWRVKKVKNEHSIRWIKSESTGEPRKTSRQTKLAAFPCDYHKREARDIKKILNDKWVLWTSFFNSNSLCFFPFYLMFDYISVSRSYFEWTGNHKQQRIRRRRRSRSNMRRRR